MAAIRTKMVRVPVDAMMSLEDGQVDEHASFEVSSEFKLETTALRFVTVTAMSLKQHRSKHNTAETRNVRRHVMKDYLRRQNARPRREPSLNVSTLSDHVGRFRLFAKPTRRRVNHSSEEDSSRTLSPATKPVPRVLVPKDPLLLQELVAIPLPIDTSTPGTMTLLEYYHTSFWANSLAVNPEGKWMTVAISDSAILHATLCLVALHKFQMKGVPLANSYFYHRGEAMRLITTRLDEPDNATSNNTIGAIAILSTADNTVDLPAAIQGSHLGALLTLVNLRGGIDGMSSNKHIKRVVAWADVLHATAHNTLPQLGTAKCTTSRDTRPLLNLVKRHGYSTLGLRAASDDIIPSPLRDIFQDLRLLAKSKPLLLHAKSGESAAELRPIFSAVLYMTERRILELGQGALLTSENINEGHDDGLETLFCAEAVKAACLIFTFHGLRDLAISANFFEKLVFRLKDALENILDHYRRVGYSKEAVEHESEEETLLQESGLPAKYLTFLLWLMVNGWKGCSLDKQGEDRQWFVDNAACLCCMAGISSAVALGSKMQRIVFLPDYCLQTIRGFWNDIEATRLRGE